MTPIAVLFIVVAAVVIVSVLVFSIGSRVRPVPDSAQTRDVIRSRGQGERVKAIYVIDGDTIQVYNNGRQERVRFLGVDAPETRHPTKRVERMGPEATRAVQAMIPRGSYVTLVADKRADQVDMYGRRLAHVFNDQGVNVSHTLLAQGLAVPTTFRHSLRGPYGAVARDAKRRRVGVWSRRMTLFGA